MTRTQAERTYKSVCSYHNLKRPRLHHYIEYLLNDFPFYTFRERYDKGKEDYKNGIKSEEAVWFCNFTETLKQDWETIRGYL